MSSYVSLVMGVVCFVTSFICVARATTLPPECTGQRMDYGDLAAPDCGKNANQCEKINGSCVGEDISIRLGSIQYKCTSEGAVEANKCISWHTSEICGDVSGCMPDPDDATKCIPDNTNILRYIYFNQAGIGGDCTVVTGE